MLITILVCVGLIAIDQLIKYLMVQILAGGGAIPLIPGVIELRYAENDGAAFSILAGQQTLLIILTGIVLLVIGYIMLFRRPKNKMEYIALIMIFSGGVGNLINRIAQGYVVDYFNVLFMRFAVFNFADILVCVGVGLFVLAVILDEVKIQRAKKADALNKTGGEVKPKVPQEKDNGAENKMTANSEAKAVQVTEEPAPEQPTTMQASPANTTADGTD